MKREETICLLLSIFAFLLILATLFFVPLPYNSSKIENNTVLNVIDGDTLEYYDSNLNQIITVRLLCVDTPEKGETGYEEAKEYLKSLVLGKEIILTNSIINEDDYGRALRYVYLNDLLINKMIVENGYGDLWIIPPENCNEMK
jgi:micrococcal nuclease